MGKANIGFYASILRRRLGYVLAIAFSVLLASLLITQALPSVYSASAKILAEAPQIPAELARSTVPIGGVEQLQILQQQITTRDDLLALARKLDVYEDGKMMRYGEDVVKDMRSRIAFEQLQFDTPSRDQSATVFSVSFLANNPDLAAKVANELAAMILGRNQRQRTDRAGSTLQFFNREVDRLSAELARLEASILTFKTENRETLPESLDFRRSQQGNMQERLISLEREESDLHTRRGGLIAAFTTSGQPAGNVSLTPEQQMLGDLNRALADQLAIFSEDSPNISALRARVAALQAKLVSTHVPEKADGAAPSGKGSEPFGLNLQLADIDKRLQALATEKITAARRVEELTRSITGTPASDTVLTSMERNRENIQTQYNAAIARRAEALTGEQIEMRSDGGRFSLLEAATPPSTQISPNRKRIIGMGAAVGIGLGLGFVVLLELLNRTVRRPSELERLLQSPALAVIPNIRPNGRTTTSPRRTTRGWRPASPSAAVRTPDSPTSTSADAASFPSSPQPFRSRMPRASSGSEFESWTK